MKKTAEKKELLLKDKPFEMKGEVKIDNRGREKLFDVQHNGVTIEFTANISEALAVQRSSMGSILYSINTATGTRTRHV